MKFPYGNSDFYDIIKEGYYYLDKTDKIPLLEENKSQLFIRPRRFGKSLVLSMLENYYDVAKKDEFAKIFGHLKIGKKPTKKRNSYFILKLDFSCVDSSGAAEDVKQALFDHVNVSIKSFYQYYNYKAFNLPEIEINRENALYSLSSLTAAIKITPYPIYLLIDEYDNFANTVIMGVQSRKSRYEALVHEEGVLMTFFKAVKASTSSTMFDRVFITGVSPVVMSDITSGYNIAENIYFEPEYNDLCGFKDKDMQSIISQIVAECDLKEKKGQEEQRNPKKIYAIDNGFKKIFDYAIGDDMSKLYENTVFLHLRRKTREIYYFKQKQEVDFYLKLEGKSQLINVSYDISAEKTRKRELEGLQEAMEYFHCDSSWLITNDYEEEFSINGKIISIVPLYKWLLEN